MCGRIVNRSSPGYLREQFDEAAAADILEEAGLLPRYNIAPSSYMPAVRLGDNGGQMWSLMRWGLIPRWSKPDQIPERTFNARSETVAEKPSFRDAYKKRRCVLPVSGYYEWTGTEGSKQPYFFHRGEGKPVLLAGIWETWNYEDNHVESCTVLTTASTGLLSDYHHRMPVFLENTEIDEWLTGDPEKLKRLFNTVSTKDFNVYPVSTEVNSARNDYAELINQINLPNEGHQKSGAKGEQDDLLLPF